MEPSSPSRRSLQRFDLLVAVVPNAGKKTKGCPKGLSWTDVFTGNASSEKPPGMKARSESLGRTDELAVAGGLIRGSVHSFHTERAPVV